MPRNGSSVYSLPAGNPVIPGTTIATAWANSTLTDIATALTQSLSTDGSTVTVSLAGKTLNAGVYTNPVFSTSISLTGGQIAFPAVAVPSANANTLDDYEEGTWTPVLTFTTPGNLNVVYSTQVGQYIKIGRLVQLNWRTDTTTFTHTTASGNVAVTGQPFAVPAGEVNGPCGSLLAGRATLTANYTYVASKILPGGTNIELWQGSSNGSNAAQMTVTNFPTAVNYNVIGNISYFATS